MRLWSRRSGPSTLAGAEIRVFHCLYRPDIPAIPSDAAVPLDTVDVPALLDEMTKVRNAFVGFIETGGPVLQFFCDVPDETITVDVPDPNAHGSHTTTAAPSDVLRISSEIAPPLARIIDRFEMSFEPHPQR